ncbi:MAG: glycoside hydrolase [Bacteroidales bacterium]|nr:glycoside hydrolase [Bacteroidales bacterium]
MNHYFLIFLLLLLGVINANSQKVSKKQEPKGAYYTGEYRNLFKEIGKSQQEIDARVEQIYTQLFYGNDSTQRVYYPVGDDMAYIKDTYFQDVRTEGMSYGMMVAVQLNKKKEFNALWKYAKTYMQNKTGYRKGYFAWSGNFNTHTVNDMNSAPDGEEYFVTALFFASHRWGDSTGIFNYKAEANQLLHDMVHLETRNGGIQDGLSNMFNHTEKKVVFVTQGPHNTFTDPSYHLPAFYKLWAVWADKDNDFWTAVADTSKAYLPRAVHPVSGLVTEYMSFAGKPQATDFNANSDKFCGDSWRVAMNLGVDVHWWGNEVWQETLLSRWINFFNSQGKDYKTVYNWDGSPVSFTWGHSVGCVAMNATGILGTNNEKSADYVQELWDSNLPEGVHRYYNGLLYMLGYLNCSGKYKIWMPEK